MPPERRTESSAGVCVRPPLPRQQIRSRRLHPFVALPQIENATMPPGLSKSRIISHRQCPKRLWLHVNRPDLGDNAATESVMAVGNAVGALARDMIPEGVLIDVRSARSPAPNQQGLGQQAPAGVVRSHGAARRRAGPCRCAGPAGTRLAHDRGEVIEHAQGLPGRRRRHPELGAAAGGRARGGRISGRDRHRLRLPGPASLCRLAAPGGCHPRGGRASRRSAAVDRRRPQHPVEQKGAAHRTRAAVSCPL